MKMVEVETYGLTYSYLCDLLSDDELKKLVSITSSNLNKPWLVNILMYFLSDSNPAVSISDRDVVKNLYKAMVKFQDSSWIPFFSIDSGEIDLEKLIQYTSQTRYCIESSSGWRVATANEVNDGIYMVENGQVIELVNKPALELEKSEQVFINMFAWAVSGLWRYYLKAGYKCEFDSTGRLKEPEIKYIKGILPVINRMSDLLADDTYFDSLIEKLKRIKKTGAYKYPTYSSNEIKADESLAFIVNQLSKKKPKYKTSLSGKCWYIIKNKGTISNQYSTEDKMTLRKGYYELMHPDDKPDEDSEQSKAEIEANKELCDKIRAGVGDRLFSESEFAVKIVNTIANNGYRRCSDKQKRVLTDAVNKINTARALKERQKQLEKSGNKNSTSTFDDFNLANMSDLLGKGLINRE